MAAVALAAYVFGEEVGLDATRGVFVSRRATRHLGLLAAVMLLVLAFGAWLQIPQLLTTSSGVVTGATYSRRPRTNAGAVGAGRAPRY